MLNKKEMANKVTNMYNIDERPSGSPSGISNGCAANYNIYRCNDDKSKTNILKPSTLR